MYNFPLKRVISFIVALIFLFSDFAIGATNRSLFQNKKVNYDNIIEQNASLVTKKKALQEGDEAALQNSKLQTSQKIDIASVKDISDIHIPETLGKISEVYNAPIDESRITNNERPRIIHFQDLHTQYDAQKNSAKIIEHLYETYNIDLVLSEGAFGKIDTTKIKELIIDKKTRDLASKLLMKTGELTGEEYVILNKDYPIEVWGVEDKELYYENIGQFNKLIKCSENAQVFLNQVEQAIKALKPAIYNKGIKELEEKVALYNDKKLDLNAYLDYLTQTAKKLNLDIATSCPNIALLQKSLELEKTLQLTNVTEEARLYNILLTQELTTKGKTKELDELATKTALFQQEKISSNKFYVYLKELGQKLNLPLTNYKNLSGFTDYLGIIAKMESYKIYTELQTLMDELKYKTCDNKGQENLLTIDKNAAFLKDFFNLKVSNEEIENFLTNKDKHTVGYFKQVITRLTGKTSSTTEGSPERSRGTGKTNFIDYNPEIIDNHFQELIDFYQIVWERDKAIVENSIKRMNYSNAQNSVLIVGGFHTKGMMKMFRDKGISYVVLSANSNSDMDDTLYHDLLAGKRKAIDELIPLANEIKKESLRLELLLENIEKAAQRLGIAGLAVCVFETDDKTLAKNLGDIAVALQNSGIPINNIMLYQSKQDDKVRFLIVTLKGIQHFIMVEQGKVAKVITQDQLQLGKQVANIIIPEKGNWFYGKGGIDSETHMVSTDVLPFTDGTRILWPMPVVAWHRVRATNMLEKALAAGVRAMEIDAQLTKDGIFITVHDKTVVKIDSKDKGTDAEKALLVPNLTKAEADEKIGDETINLEDLFKRIQGKGIAIFLDTKDWTRDIPGYTDRYMDALSDLIIKYNMQDYIFSCGFNDYPVLLNQRLKDKGSKGILIGEAVPRDEKLDPETLDMYINKIKASEGRIFGTHAGKMTPDIINTIHKAGLMVLIGWPDPAGTGKVDESIFKMVDLVWSDDYEPTEIQFGKLREQSISLRGTEPNAAGVVQSVDEHDLRKSL